MRKTIIIFTLLISFFSLQSCSMKETNNVSPQNSSNPSHQSLEGNWVLKNVLQGDVMDFPCSGIPDKVIDLTLKINENGHLSANGRSAINSYFGEIQLNSNVSINKLFDVKKVMLASTLMGASEELMNCEGRFFEIFNNAKNIQIEGNLLKIGIKSDGKNPEDAGSWLIFEKKK